MNQVLLITLFIRLVKYFYESLNNQKQKFFYYFSANDDKLELFAS